VQGAAKSDQPVEPEEKGQDISKGGFPGVLKAIR
jgi:hypothetical protein